MAATVSKTKNLAIPKKTWGQKVSRSHFFWLLFIIFHVAHELGPWKGQTTNRQLHTTPVLRLYKLQLWWCHLAWRSSRGGKPAKSLGDPCFKFAPLKPNRCDPLNHFDPNFSVWSPFNCRPSLVPLPSCCDSDPMKAVWKPGHCKLPDPNGVQMEEVYVASLSHSTNAHSLTPTGCSEIFWSSRFV